MNRRNSIRLRSAGHPDSLNGESCFHLFNEQGGVLRWNDYHCNQDRWGVVETSFVCKKGIRSSYYISFLYWTLQ